MVERVLRRIALVLLVLAAAACADDPSPPPPAPDREPSGTEATPEMEPEVRGDPFRSDPEVMARGLEVPWDIAFAEDLLLVTERSGRVRAIRDGSLEEEPVARVDAAEMGEGGLLGIALHPEWPEEPRAYLYYTHGSGSNRVSVFEVADPQGDLRFGDEEVIVDGIPAAANHDGGRIEFGPDGFLYVTTGDAGDSRRSADLGSLGGKILRVDEDGNPPSDNPFDGSPVWAYGLRNPQGIAWDDEGRLYAADHGPSGEFGLCCRDELNLITEGSFYGWPFRSGGAATGAGEPPEEPEDPIAESGNDTWAPSGIAYLEAEGERWILMANLRGGHLRRFTISTDAPRQVEEQDAAVDGFGRLRHVAVGGDGCVYVLTSNRDGRGDPADQDDRVLRFCG